MKKIIKIVLAVLAALSVIALVTVSLIIKKSSGYTGRYIYTSEKSTRIFDVEDRGDSLHIRYTLSDDETENTDNTTDSTYEWYFESFYGWRGRDPVRYAEMEFDIPEEIISKGIEADIYDRNRYEVNNVYMYIGNDAIYFFDDFSGGFFDARNDEISEINNSFDEDTYWYKAERVRTDYGREFMIIKCAATIIFVLAASAFAIIAFRHMRSALRISISAFVVLAAAVTFTFVLRPQTGGKYTVDDDSGTNSVAEILSYKDKSCIMMVYDDTQTDKIRYNVVTTDYILNKFSIAMVSGSESMITANPDGAEYIVGNPDSADYYHYEVKLRKDNLYRIVWFARYLLLLPVIISLVYTIIYGAKEHAYRRLNPDYPYADYRVKRLAYLDKSMEYMRKYLRDNMEGAQVCWHKELFAVDNTAQNDPHYSAVKACEAALQIIGKGSAKQVDVNDNYCFIYNRHKTFIGMKIADRVYMAYELEAGHE